MALSAGAQQLRWDVHAGVNLSGIRSEDDDAFQGHTQFQAGFSVTGPLGQNVPVYWQTGLDFTGRGWSSRVTVNLYYLQLPVTLSYRFEAAPIVSIRPLMGIYYACGLFSNVKLNGETLRDAAGERMDFFKEYDGERPFKRSDFGVRIGADVVLKDHYCIGLGYDLGLTNIDKDLFDDGTKLSNSVFYFRAGYIF